MIYKSVAELAERARGHQGFAASLAAVLGRVGYGPHYTVRKGTRCRVRVTHADGTHTVPGLSDLARRLRDGVEPRPVPASSPLSQLTRCGRWRNRRERHYAPRTGLPRKLLRSTSKPR